MLNIDNNSQAAAPTSRSPKRRRESSGDAGYLHGYSEVEQERLIDQALHLEPTVFAQLDFGRARRVIEVGCGVGAQISILRRRFGHLTVTGVDRSREHLTLARRRLADDVCAGRVELVESQGESLPFATGAFDGAFLCWLLEHVPAPLDVLAEIRRVMADGAVIYCTEMFNATMFTEPRCPAIATFWGLFNARQIELRGNPHIGAGIGGLLRAAGLRQVEVTPLPILLDGRTNNPADRARFFDYWRRLFASAVSELVAASRVDDDLLSAVERELRELEANPNAVFFLSAMQARAIK